MTSWRGIIVAAALPFNEDLSVNYDKYQEHVFWLSQNGCDGIVPNGSLGEYQVLSDRERADVVKTAIEASPDGFGVFPGTGAYGATESRRWAEQALEAGAAGVLSLPPNSYLVNDDEVLVHYKELNEVGLPIIAYNNPFDTKIDLTPELIARVGEFDNVVAVKEFSGDVRRVHQIRHLAPRLDVLAGADDVLLELVLMGAVGWIGGFSNAMPQQCRVIYDLAISGDVQPAVELYRELLDAFTWDSKHTFIQAIKLAMDMAGRYGGPTRLPRLPLSPTDEARARKDFERAFAANL